MTGVVPARARQYFPNGQGKPLNNGRVYAYHAGTLDPMDTWQDANLTVLNAWPIELNSRGECLIFMSPMFLYKLVVTEEDINGVEVTVLIDDPVLAGGDKPLTPQFTADYFSGDGVTTQFVLSVNPTSENNTFVHIAGTYVPKSAYSLADNVVTFTTPPAVGANNVEIQTIMLVEFSASASLISSQVAQSTLNAQAAQDWATKTSGEVVAGQGYGAKKYAQDAGASATSASASQAAAANSASSALISSGNYVDEPTGRAAVADTIAFKVQGSGNVAAYEYRRINATTPSSLIATYASMNYIDDIFHERFFAAQAKSFEDRRMRVQTQRKKLALVLIGLGQSNNAAYNTPVSPVSVSNTAVQFIGGNAVGDLDFYPVASNHSVNWADVASYVPWATGTVEHPLTGAIIMLEGLFPKIYAHSAAYGGNAILMLSGAARLANLCAFVHRMCDFARADGYEPVVAYTLVQGEANMSSYGLLDEATYYTHLSSYTRIAQRVAAQAMDAPHYKAPIILHNLAESSHGADSRGIQNAIGRVAAETPNAMLGGPLGQWALNGDLIHGYGNGFRQRGEQNGWMLGRFFTDGTIFTGLYPVDAFRSGDMMTVTWNRELERDASNPIASLLNVGYALGGAEYVYDGTNYVAIRGVSVVGRRTTFTLASNPGPAVGTEEFRVGMQTTNPAGGTWPQLAAGSQFRSASLQDRWVSPYDGTTQYVWASPRKLPVRAA